MIAQTNADEYRQRMRDRARPFLGHEGVGSRISVNQKKPYGLVLKESFFGQIMVLAGLLLFGPGLTAVMIMKRGDAEFLKTPKPILVILAFFSLIAWISATKYFFRLVAGRRIEVSGYEKTVSLYTGGRRPQRQVSRTDIVGFDIISTWYHADSDWIENYTLRLKCREDETLDLCTSDSKNNIESVKSLIERTIE